MLLNNKIVGFSPTVAVAQVSAEVTTVAGNGGDNTTSAGGTSGAITHYGK